MSSKRNLLDETNVLLLLKQRFQIMIRAPPVVVQLFPGGMLAFSASRTEFGVHLIYIVYHNHHYVMLTFILVNKAKMRLLSFMLPKERGYYKC